MEKLTYFLIYNSQTNHVLAKGICIISGGNFTSPCQSNKSLLPFFAKNVLAFISQIALALQTQTPLANQTTFLLACSSGLNYANGKKQFAIQCQELPLKS